MAGRIAWVSILGALAVGCGGQVSHAPDQGSMGGAAVGSGGQLNGGNSGGKTTASGRACVTSFGCPTGERCDAGQCVLDSGCPKPFGPRRLPTSHPPLFYTTGIELYEGAEHLVALDAQSAQVLVRLPDGPALTIARPAACKQLAVFEPDGPFRVWCRGGDGTLNLGFRELLPKGEAGLEASQAVTIDLPAGADITDGSFPDPNSALVVGGDQVSHLDLQTLVLSPLVSLGGRQRSAAMVVGTTPTLVGKAASDQQTDYSTIELRAGSDWQGLGSLPKSLQGFVRFVRAGQWYVVADLGDETVRVYRSSNHSLQAVGEAPLVVQRAVVAPDADKPTGHLAFDCADSPNCTLYRIDLEPPAATRLVEVAIPTTDPTYPSQTRRLACDGMEVFLYTLHHQIGPWPTLEYYVVRVVPSG